MVRSPMGTVLPTRAEHLAHQDYHRVTVPTLYSRRTKMNPKASGLAQVAVITGLCAASWLVLWALVQGIRIFFLL